MLRRYFESMIGARSLPGASTDLDWSQALHRRVAQQLPERIVRIRDLLGEIDRAVRAAGAALTERTAADQIAEINELLDRPVAQPAPIAPRRAALPLAMNIGWEIEIARLNVEARCQRTIIPGRWFLLGGLIDDAVADRGGFSVQTDAGKIELVSIPPDGAANPVGVAYRMAGYAANRHADIRSSGKKDAWKVLQRIDGSGRLKHDGHTIEVRVAPEPGALDGEFHATVGIHAASLPWFLLSGAAGNDGFADANDQNAALVPGHTFWSTGDRDQVLEALAGFRQRCNRADINPSPALEGLVFLLFAYITAGNSAASRERDLSPKHRLLVLCRTDLAYALSVTPEWSSGRRSARAIETLRKTVLESLPDTRRDQPIFSGRFGDPVPEFGEIRKAFNSAGAAKMDDALLALSKEIFRRKKGKIGYRPISTTVTQWLTDLFAAAPEDRLSQAYHQRRGNDADAYLHRGMGSLGTKTDQLPNGELAPIFEYRRLTPDDRLPVVDRWRDLAREFSRAVTVVNAAATDGDRSAARAEIELIRRTSVPRQLRSKTRDPVAEVDRICENALKHLINATMQSELWTLVDRARGLTRPRSARLTGSI